MRADHQTRPAAVDDRPCWPPLGQRVDGLRWPPLGQRVYGSEMTSSGMKFQLMMMMMWLTM